MVVRYVRTGRLVLFVTFANAQGQQVQRSQQGSMWIYGIFVEPMM